MTLLPLDPAQTLRELEAAEAILRGHFVLSSGLHSETYLQCARLLTDPARAKRIGDALALKAQERARADGIGIDLVAAPAMGGVIIGFLVAQALNIPSLFCERVEGTFRFRRGFSLPAGARVLVAEDVVTTGLSSRETFEAVREAGGVPVMETCIIDRTPGGSDRVEGLPLLSLLRLEVPTYRADALPEHLRDVPAVKPGSRFLNKSTS